MIAWCLAAAAVSAAPAKEPPDAVIGALEQEIERAISELSLPEADGPYYVGLLLTDVDEVGIAATLGGVLTVDTGADRRLSAEVRVGTPALDNSNFEAFRDGWRSTAAVLGDASLPIRHDAWLLIDRSYKEAVEAFAAKEAARRRRAKVDDTPDFAPGPPQVSVSTAADLADVHDMIGATRDASAVFLNHPGVEASRVSTVAVAGRRVSLDSGGTRVQAPLDQLSVRIAGRARAPDGATVVDQVLFLGRGSQGMPDARSLEDGAEQVAEALEKWPTYEVATEEYIGPVVFEGAAAADVFRHLFVPAVLGTPPEEEPPRGSRQFVWDDAAEGGPMRLRRRILPRGWSVTDDPTRFPHSPSSYTLDWEGEPAETVRLVQDGIMRAHLMTRTPSRAMPGSNGHARGPGGTLMRAMPSNLAIEPRRRLSDRKLHRQALRIASEYDLDHYVLIRRLTDPSTSDLDGGPMFTGRSMFGFDEGERLPPPIAAFRVYADGREQPVRGWNLSGLDTRSLKDIAAAGMTERHAVLMGQSAAGGVPVLITAPHLLLPEVELTPAPGNVEKPPLLASPLAPGGE